MEADTRLSSRLSSLLGSEFFRPLSRPSAPIYVDCADRLSLSADEGGQLTHGDTLALIRDVLALHPRAQLAEDEGANFGDLKQRAGQIFNKLLEAGWLHERTVSLDERWVLLTPRLRPLIRLLRNLARDRIGELKDFAATLLSICRTLLAEGALDPQRLTAEEFRQTIKELVDRVERAGDQMHGVEILILRHEERQRVSATASETLERFLVEFHAGEHMVCYDTLQEGNLIPRLRQARAVVQDAMADPFSKQRLAEGLAAHWKMDPNDPEVYTEAGELLRKLDAGMTAISAKQRIIDGRMADFSKLSSQRYHYQTQIRGKRPEQVKEYSQAADTLHKGQSFAELSRQPGMPLLCPELEIFFGREALSRARRTRASVDLSLATLFNADDVLSAQNMIQRHNLNAITPQRAGRFIHEHLPQADATLSSEALHLSTEEDFLDLVAMLTFDHANLESSPSPLHWKITAARANNGLEPNKILTDLQAQRQVERFTVERIP